MSIRTATPTDLPRIVELGSQSLKDGPYAGIINDVPAQAKKCAEMVMREGKILLAENDEKRVVGLLAFIIADHHFSGQKYAAELMWYVEPDQRKGAPALRLLWEAEKLAKEAGAESFLFTAPNDDVAALYARFGYKKLEVTFQKILCHS
jgi:predicted N-acetyltransferase YhbS